MPFRSFCRAALAAVVLTVGVPAVHAADFSFNGKLSAANPLQEYAFTVSTSTFDLVTLEVVSFSTGGFDPLFSLFGPQGKIDTFDQDNFPLPITLATRDEQVEIDLEAGRYFVQVAPSSGATGLGNGNFSFRISGAGVTSATAIPEAGTLALTATALLPVLGVVARRRRS